MYYAARETYSIHLSIATLYSLNGVRVWIANLLLSSQSTINYKIQKEDLLLIFIVSIIDIVIIDNTYMESRTLLTQTPRGND